MKKRIGCFLIVLSCCCICSAQQVGSSGGYAVKSEISVNWILGGSLSDIYVVGMETFNKINQEQSMESEISLKIYPNPASDFINIEITPVDSGRINFEFYNISGIKVLDKVASYQPVIQVSLNDIPSGIYCLKAFQKSKDQIFKIEKIIKK
jgi:hypothetical protein